MTDDRRSPGGHRLVVGVDVGGTKVLAALVDVSDPEAPVALETLRRPLPGKADGRGDPGGLASLVAAMVSEVDPSGSAEAIGLGLAGFVGLDGVAVGSPNVPQIVGVDVSAEVLALCGLPVTVDNDANCVARVGLALSVPRVTHLVAVTLGTGVGGGLVIDGRLVRGARGLAGEPGHMVVDPDGPPCPCGQRGCWERYASGAGLEMLGREAVAAGLLPAGENELRGEDLVAAARAGGEGALGVMDQFARWVALGVANLVNLVDPELVVIGGGLADAVDVYLPAVLASLRDNPTVGRRDVRVEAAPGGALAGALGAALAAGEDTGAATRSN